ncbi:MAG: hypothetical protein ACK4NS_10910 [Saprospiraceae bacterium]
MKRKYFFRTVPIAALLAVWALGGLAQTPRAFEHSAQAAFAAGDYYAAMKRYEEAHSIEPQRVDLSYQYAESARLFGAYLVAEAQYGRVLSADINGAYPDAAYKQAVVKKFLGKYEEALPLFERFARMQAGGSPLRIAAEREAEICEWAMEKVTRPDVSVNIERLSDLLNTPESDFGAIQRGDTLNYCTYVQLPWGDKHYPARPLIQVMESVGGRSPYPAAFNDPKRHTAHPAVSPDGLVMVYNLCDYEGLTGIRCELYFRARRPDGSWSEPVRLPEPFNTPNHTATQPHVTAVQNGYYTLYFASDRPGGKGGLDLWQARFSKTGAFMDPVNLAALNTEENDVTPFFDEKNKALFFSSKGYRSLGGYDIYVSKLKGSRLQAPEHLDVPYNSSADDYYFYPSDADYAHFTSNRVGARAIEGEDCCNDLFRLRYLPITLKTLAYQTRTQKPLSEVVFTLTELDADGSPLVVFSGPLNETDYALRRDREYIVLAQKEFYDADSARISTHSFPRDRKLQQKLYLTPEINLAVRAFNLLNNEELAGVQINLYQVGGRVAQSFETGAGETKTRIGALREFMIVATKPHFEPDTVWVNEQELDAVNAGGALEKSLYLVPASMAAYLPLALYFDNDEPDPRSRLATTRQSYEDLAARYMARKQAFIQNYSAGLQGDEKAEAERRLAAFFDEEVAEGLIKLESFSSNLELFLKSGAGIDIQVKAFASPLAPADYNLALTRRRVACVTNYMRRYNGGVLLGYMQSGKLRISTLPYGETAASATVSDDPRDRRNSVYSPEASRERRAEILEIRVIKN